MVEGTVAELVSVASVPSPTVSSPCSHLGRGRDSECAHSWGSPQKFLYDYQQLVEEIRVKAEVSLTHEDLQLALREGWLRSGEEPTLLQATGTKGGRPASTPLSLGEKGVASLKVLS